MSIISRFVLLVLIVLPTFLFGQAVEDAEWSTPGDRVGQFSYVQDSCGNKLYSIEPAYGDLFFEGDMATRVAAVVPNWLFVIFCLLIATLVIMRVVFPRIMFEMFRSLTNVKLAQQFYREQETSFSIVTVLLGIGMVVSFAIYFSLIIYRSFPDTGSFSVLFLFVFTLLSVLFSLRYLSLLVMRVVFPIAEDVGFYSFAYFNNRKLMALLLVPFSMLIAYLGDRPADPFIWLSVGFLLAMTILELIQGLQVGRKYFSSNRLHFLLYICTLEIAPIAILTKAIVVTLS